MKKLTKETRDQFRMFFRNYETGYKVPSIQASRLAAHIICEEVFEEFIIRDRE
jgi:hypothetical protein